jgi:hypothetical protein
MSFCKNLHAKCYVNKKECTITSLNRISDEIRISLEKISKEPNGNQGSEETESSKLTTSKLARKMSLKTDEEVKGTIAIANTASVIAL